MFFLRKGLIRALPLKLNCLFKSSSLEKVSKIVPSFLCADVTVFFMTKHNLLVKGVQKMKSFLFPQKNLLDYLSFYKLFDTSFILKTDFFVKFFLCTHISDRFFSRRIFSSKKPSVSPFCS